VPAVFRAASHLFREGGDHVAAGFLAAAARQRAVFAVRVPVAPAFDRVYFTRRGTRLELGGDDPEVSLAMTGHDASCCEADVGAVKVQPDAADQAVELVLSEARIGARRTRLRAI
jgi:hypothetical protein